MRFHRLSNKELAGPFGRVWKRVITQVGLALVLAYFIQLYLDDLQIISWFRTFVLASANDLVLTFGHIYIFVNLDRNYDWLKQTRQRFWLGAVFHTGYSAIAFLIVQLVLFKLLFGMSMKETISWFGEYWMLPIAITAFIIVLTTTIGFFQNWKKTFLEEEQMKQEMLAYKFDSLRGQINPHLMFGSFDHLKAEIQDSPEQAVLMIQKMSRLYRYLLEFKDMEMVSIHDEAKVIDVYLDLLSYRLGKELSCELALSDEEDRFVVPFAVQQVVEWLLKHLQEKTAVINLKITQSEGCIKVSLSSERFEETVLPTGELENLKARYTFFTDEPIKVEGLEGQIIVSLPILETA